MIEVAARVTISQPNYMGKKLHIHAHKGELGKIMREENGLPVVRWYRSGTSCVVTPEQIIRRGDAKL